MDNRIRLKTARKKSGAKKTSWWNSNPDLTKIAALIAALTALLGLIVKLPDVVAFFAPTFTPSPSYCIAYVTVAYDNKTVQANAGRRPFFNINAEQPLSATYMLELEVDALEVGKVQFKYDLPTKRFEITSVVDQNCKPVPENDLLTKSFWLENGGKYEFSINEKRYTLELFYDADKTVVEGTFSTKK